MIKEEEVNKLLHLDGSQLDCWLPLEISDPKSGDVATGHFAECIIDSLEEEMSGRG